MRKILITYLLLTFCAFAQSAMAQKEYNIVFIGNSITYGATHKQPAKTNPTKSCVKYLQDNGFSAVHGKNAGKSGKTTKDYTPDRQKGYYGLVKKSADELMTAYPEGKLVFSIMLGTNDAAIRTKKTSWIDDIYKKDMCLIIDSLQERYPEAIFVIHQDPYFSPNIEKESGTKFDENCLKQLQSYWKVDQEIVKEYGKKFPGKFFLGSDEIYAYFEKNHKEMMTPEEGINGTYYLHPNPSGSAELGKLWGAALAKILK